MADLNPHRGVDSLLMSFDETICIFEVLFLEQEEAVKSFWACNPIVNVDEVMLEEVDKVIQDIKHRNVFRGVILQRQRHGYCSSKLLEAIGSNCSALEILDIPGINLLQQDIRFLSNCVSLKYINITYEFETIELVEKLIENNPHLEGVSLRGYVTNKLIKSLPKTLKWVEFIKKTLEETDIINFWKRLKTWPLEKLHITLTLTDMFFYYLYTLTNLKYLSIQFKEIDNSLEILFRNNPGLEEVSLKTCCRIDGACLKYLPPSLNTLKLNGVWDLDCGVFLECVKTWNIHSLTISTALHINFILSILNVAPSLSDLSINIKNIIPDQILHLDRLAQLKYLHLAYYSKGYNNLWERVLPRCLGLEQLKVSSRILNLPIFPVIKYIPVLKEFSLDNVASTQADYTHCLTYLGTNQTLTTIKFIRCTRLHKVNILALIRDCKTLTKLVLELGTSCSLVDNDFLQKIVLEMKKQTNRIAVLLLEVICWPNQYKFQNPLTQNLHPMLKVEFFTDNFI